MVNEFTYCPRLFFYEWVDGVFKESADTIEGAVQHKRVDEKATALPDSADLPDYIHSRSVTLSGERAARDRQDGPRRSRGSVVTPVEYKHGKPREGANGLELWPADKAQLAVQSSDPSGKRILIAAEGIVYYRKTGQRVRVQFDDALVAETRWLIGDAWSTALAEAKFRRR